MNDRYDAGHGGDQYELVGYDEYGQPVYRQVPGPRAYDGYGTPQQQGYGHDPYTTGGGQGYGQGGGYDAGQQQAAYQDPYQGNANGGGYGSYDAYGGQATGPGAQPGTPGGAPRTRSAGQTAYIPQQTAPAPAEDTEPSAYGRSNRTEPSGYGRSGAGAGGRAGRSTGDTARRPQDGADGRQGTDGDDPAYRTEQFAFVEEPDGDSEDVIDWLNFTENRTERREEAKRRARSRLIALTVVLALVAVGGVGYLWFAGKLPGSSGDDKPATTTAAGAQKRDVIVVHLHNTGKGGTSTALLVDNTTTKQGATVLLPNSLALTDDDGNTTTLAKSVDDDGSSGTLDSLDTVLGTDIEGTWRLDTPYLNNLVELVGNIEIDTNADVPDPNSKKKGQSPLVNKGRQQTLSGRMAVAYATYRAPGEAQDAQLKRFGQVMQGILRKVSTDAGAATTTVRTLAQIIEPPLTDKDLGAFLAKLADHAKGGDHRTALLPVQEDGTLSEESDTVVEDLLGGAAKSPEAGDAVRVGIRNATGAKDAAEQARVVLLNGGYTYLDAGAAPAAEAVSRVTYADAAHKEAAAEVAKTLGLPVSAVRKGKTTSNATVSVVLGQDYEVNRSAG